MFIITIIINELFCILLIFFSYLECPQIFSSEFYYYFFFTSYELSNHYVGRDSNPQIFTWDEKNMLLSYYADDNINIFNHLLLFIENKLYSILLLINILRKCFMSHIGSSIYSTFWYIYYLTFDIFFSHFTIYI